MAERLTQLWDDVVRSLGDKDEITSADLAFTRMAQPVGILDGTLLIAVPSGLVRDRLEIKLRENLMSILREVSDEPVDRFAITVDEDMHDSEDDGEPEPEPEPVLDLPAPRPAPSPLTADPSRLNPKYTFETFVIGSSNRFAHAAARAVAEAPARAYNPLFIYGGSGLGKTHLLHAIGHYARHLFRGIQVRYVNSEEFTNDFINSIRDDKAESFQRRYRQVDVLLIDDSQFLGGTERTVVEFFHTFTSLHNANKQVVITSDTSPKKLQGFEDRLISRFEWGLLTDVQPPDLETRIAILRKKAQTENLQASDEVLSYIASRISTNIRELEGALIRVTAFANLNNQPVELSLAELVLRDMVTDDDAQEVTAPLIMKETADYFSISIDALQSASAPLGPKRPKNSPCSMFRLISCKALKPVGVGRPLRRSCRDSRGAAYVLEMFFNSRAGMLGHGAGNKPHCIG